MKASLITIFTIGLLTGTTAGIQAQHNYHNTKTTYFTTGVDFATVSTAFGNITGDDANFRMPRLSMINLGTQFHINISKNVGLYTGANIKNIGFIEKYKNPDSTVKRRVYAIGVPLGIKVGNIERGAYLFAGGGIDIPFNYREKGFVKRSDKTSFNEWFSDRTPHVMPYAMIGYTWHLGFTVKAQYYLTDFMNQGFEIEGTKPYDGYKVHLMLFAVGWCLPYVNRFR